MSEEKKRALGRGLDLLIPAARATASPGLSSRTSAAAAAATAPALAGETVREIPIAEIERNPYQTRGHMDDTALNELAASIKASGVLQPVVVRARRREGISSSPASVAGWHRSGRGRRRCRRLSARSRTSRRWR